MMAIGRRLAVSKLFHQKPSVNHQSYRRCDLNRPLFSTAPLVPLSPASSSVAAASQYHAVPNQGAQQHYGFRQNEGFSVVPNRALAIISVDGLANRMREEVRSYARELLPSKMRMAGILADERSASLSDDGSRPPHDNQWQRQQQQRGASDAEAYAARICETFAEDGIDFELFRCSAASPDAVGAVIRAMNDRGDVHGILVFYPIFTRSASSRKAVRGDAKAPYLDRSTGVHYKSYDDFLRDVVCPAKDVEGLSASYTARWLFRARARRRSECGSSSYPVPSQVDFYIPCTALAVIKILEEYYDHHQLSASLSSTSQRPNLRWSGLTVTVVNRSEIFGRPLAALLALEGASVYSVDDRSVLQFTEAGRNMRRCSMTLESCLQASSVIVTGVPCPEFVLPIRTIAPGTMIVNVSEYPNVDVNALAEHCPSAKLVPHVGKVTVAALEQNLVRLYQQQKGSVTNKIRS
jgi:5,10-methylene-tetrahydrofolate dehydrogenase/methenyl tetrahydrofolate cyclohydrolase